jgi:hypothetical protein
MNAMDLQFHREGSVCSKANFMFKWLSFGHE